MIAALGAWLLYKSSTELAFRGPNGEPGPGYLPVLLTLCLIGGYSDGRGSYGPGDVSIADPTVTHQPKADDDGVCFVLAVTDAGLKFEGVLGAIQKLIGG